jgi:hypothetical protein
MDEFRPTGDPDIDMLRRLDYERLKPTPVWDAVLITTFIVIISTFVFTAGYWTGVASVPK